MSIYQLPDELILKVLSYLEIKDFLSCGQGGVHVLLILNSQYFWKWTNANPIKIFSRADTASNL